MFSNVISGKSKWFCIARIEDEPSQGAFPLVFRLDVVQQKVK